MEVIQAEFARQAGVSRATISEKIKNKTLIVNAAGFLDTDNPVNRGYLDNRRRKSAEKTSTLPGGDNKNDDNSSPQNGSENGYTWTEVSRRAGIPEELLDLPMREIVTRMGNLPNTERFVKILRDLMIADEKDQRIRERRLILIDKDFVVSRLFNYIDALMSQLVEYPDSVIDELLAKARSEGLEARSEIVVSMRDGLFRVIKGAKETVINELNGLKAKYQEYERQ